MPSQIDMQRINDLRTRLDLLETRIPKAQRMTMAPVLLPGAFAELSRLLRDAAAISDEVAGTTSYIVIGTAPTVDTSVAAGTFASPDQAMDASTDLTAKG